MRSNRKSRDGGSAVHPGGALSTTVPDAGASALLTTSTAKVTCLSAAASGTIACRGAIVTPRAGSTARTCVASPYGGVGSDHVTGARAVTAVPSIANRASTASGGGPVGK